MGRVSDDYDDWGDNAELDHGRWEKNSRATLISRRGQKALRELEAALLALPEPKLAYEVFHKVERDDDGREIVSCCVLGALARHKGVVSELPEWINGDEDDPGNPEDQAHWAEKNLGMRFTLAWNLIYENDNVGSSSETDEERFTRVLAFVRRHIKPELAGVSSSSASQGDK